jgi:hypothetical protein
MVGDCARNLIPWNGVPQPENKNDRKSKEETVRVLKTTDMTWSGSFFYIVSNTSGRSKEVPVQRAGGHNPGGNVSVTEI